MSDAAESMRMRRSDQLLTSRQRSSGKPSRFAVSRPGSWAASASTTSASPSRCTVVDELVDAVVDEPLEGGSDRLDRAGCEAGADHAALRHVLGIVLGDHVHLVRAAPRAVGGAGRELLGAALDVEELGVADDRPETVRLVAPHRSGGARLGEERVHGVDITPERRCKQVGGRHGPGP